MPPTAQDRILDILESINEIGKVLGHMGIEQFQADTLRRMATERYLEIVCEATRNLPDEIKTQAPNIEWQKIIDFGNRLRHAYHATDADKVWDVIQNHLPPLKSVVESHIRAADK